MEEIEQIEFCEFKGESQLHLQILAALIIGFVF